MTTIARRVAQLEASGGNGAWHHVWRPDDLTDDQCDDWLADLRKREGWPDGDSVTVYRWAN